MESKTFPYIRNHGWQAILYQAYLTPSTLTPSASWWRQGRHFAYYFVRVVSFAYSLIRVVSLPYPFSLNVINFMVASGSSTSSTTSSGLLASPTPSSGSSASPTPSSGLSAYLTPSALMPSASWWRQGRQFRRSKNILITQYFMSVVRIIFYAMGQAML